MTEIIFTPMNIERATAFRAGGADDYGNVPERAVSDGDGMPCRVCLKNIEAGEEYLVVAHRPFSRVNPYTETGPIFLHAEECRQSDTHGLPTIFDSPTYLLRGYTADERIAYGTGKVVPREEMAAYAERILRDKEIAFVDVRSASNNCWQARVVRAA